jgi:hypothetical protein
MNTGSSFPEISQTTHLHPVPGLKQSEAITPFPLKTSWPVEGQIVPNFVVLVKVLWHLHEVSRTYVRYNNARCWKYAISANKILCVTGMSSLFSSYAIIPFRLKTNSSVRINNSAPVNTNVNKNTLSCVFQLLVGTSSTFHYRRLIILHVYSRQVKFV